MYSIEQEVNGSHRSPDKLFYKMKYPLPSSVPTQLKLVHLFLNI